MLEYFVQSGKIDLMRWSQPTAIGLLTVASVITKFFKFGFVQLDIIGLSFSIAVIAGLYALLRQQLSETMSFLLSLSIFCFNEIVFVTPTFMTDMPFLAYCVWWLVLTERLLRNEQRLDLRTTAGWCVFLVLALLTRGTGLMALPALIATAIFCHSLRKRIFILIAMFCGCWLIASLMTKFLTINALTFFQTTALREIIQLHDFARFDLRACAVATLSVIFAVSPVLMLVKTSDKKLLPTQFCCAVIGLVGASYFSYKGYFSPLDKSLALLAILCVAYSCFHLPVVAVAALRNNKAPSIMFLTLIIVCLGVLPIMAHPLTRHAIPAMVALIVLISRANSWKPMAERVIFLLTSLLIFTNVIKLQEVRLADFASLRLAQDLLTLGYQPKDIDAGWAWFCYEALVPGSTDPQSYVDRFNTWEKEAKIVINLASQDDKEERVLTHLELRHFARKIDLTLGLKNPLE